MKKSIISLLALAWMTVPVMSQQFGSYPVTVTGLTATVTSDLTPQPGKGTLMGMACDNANAGATDVYIQVFDAASAASITLGTTPPTAFFPIAQGGAGGNIAMNFTNGLRLAATTTPKGNAAPTTPLNCTLFVR